MACYRDTNEHFDLNKSLHPTNTLDRPKCFFKISPLIIYIHFTIYIYLYVCIFYNFFTKLSLEIGRLTREAGRKQLFESNRNSSKSWVDRLLCVLIFIYIIAWINPEKKYLDLRRWYKTISFCKLLKALAERMRKKCSVIFLDNIT